MTKNKDLPVRYVTHLRCATWNTWPAHISIFSEPFRLQPPSNDIDLFCVIRLISYEQRSPARRYSSRQPRNSSSLRIWRGQFSKHYTVGNSILVAPTDEVNYALPLEYAYRGEIDIQLSFAFEGNIEEKHVQELGENLSLSVMSYLNLQLGDFLTPSAPLQTGEVIDKNLRMTMSFKIAAHDRKTLLVEDLQNSIDKFQIYYRENDSRTIEKLEVALNLYSNYFRQRSIISRFLTLVMAIEALAPQAPRPTTVFNLIEKWTKEIQMLYSIYDEDSEEHSALQNLEREIAFRRHDSIRGSIRKYVLDALSRRGNPEAKVWSRRAVEIYDLRSKLVHEGALSVSELQYAENQAAKIVKLLLHALVDKSD